MTEMYNSLLALVLKVLKERGEKEVVGKKRLVLAPWILSLEL
jgi:hypothetical protein